jgi:alpha-N-acetylglucosamine transferase
MLLTHGVPAPERAWFADRGVSVVEAEPPCAARDWYARQPAAICPPVLSLLFTIFGPDFREWRRVVYLDTDIILRGALEAALPVRRLAAAPDYLHTLGDQFVRAPHARRVLSERFDLRSPSFNSGVLALRPDRIDSDAFPRIMELYDRYFHLGRFTVQPVLNLAFYRQWECLSRFSNFPYHPSLRALQGAARLPARGRFLDGCLVHLWGKEKPWARDSPFRAEWLRLLARAEEMDFGATTPTRAPRRSGPVASRVFRCGAEALRLANPAVRVLGRIRALAISRARRLRARRGGAAAPAER